MKTLRLPSSGIVYRYVDTDAVEVSWSERPWWKPWGEAVSVRYRLFRSRDACLWFCGSSGLRVECSVAVRRELERQLLTGNNRKERKALIDRITFVVPKSEMLS